MILGNTLKRIFGKKSNFLFMIVIPIVLNIFMISSTTQTIKYNIGIVDNDATDYTMDIISKLEEDNNVKILGENDDINSLIIDKTLDCAIVFESGFTQELIKGKDVTVESYSIENTNANTPIFMLINSYISASKQIAIEAEGDEPLFYVGLEQYEDSDYIVDYKTFSSSDKTTISNAVSSLGYIALGMVFLMMFSTMLILEDKMSGVYDRVTVSSLANSSYLLQHLLSYFIVALMQIVILINIMPNIINISYGETLSERREVIVVCATFALVCISIGVTISRFSKSMLMAGTITSLINLPMLMLGGCLWPREIMPEYVQRIGNFVPTTWFLKAGEDVLYGRGLSAASNEIMYMLAFAASLLILSFVIKTEKER